VYSGYFCYFSYLGISLGDILVCVARFVGVLVGIVAALAVLMILASFRLCLYSAIGLLGISGVLFMLFLGVQAVAHVRKDCSRQIISEIMNVYYFACC
jgi:hypothetical protein